MVVGQKKLGKAVGSCSGEDDSGRIKEGRVALLMPGLCRVWV